jgi:hypothetical protein
MTDEEGGKAAKERGGRSDGGKVRKNRRKYQVPSNANPLKLLDCRAGFPNPADSMGIA